MAENELTASLRVILEDPCRFAYLNNRITLRSYQREVIRAIVHSVFQQSGRSFVVMFPRQSGKNELQAHLEAYLLVCLSQIGGDLIKVSPTWKPQSLNAMHRLETVLKNGLITRTLWQKNSGYIYSIHRARISFLSGEPQAQIVGATASTLLEVDEAQDVLTTKYDKEIAPMAASTNATRVFWGTAWTSQTLLARELRLARSLEMADGIRRVFQISANDVAREVPAYDAFVREQVLRLGRQHPMICTQFFSEEIDEQAGMFPLERQHLMHGSHFSIAAPEAGRIYAFLLDVGGAELTAKPQGDDRSLTEHDLSALTVVEVDVSTLKDSALKAPSYLVRRRAAWKGMDQPGLFRELKMWVDMWKPRRIVIDATGLGAGLCAFLQKAYPGKVRPFVFSSASKSNLGWEFLSVCDTGRFKDYVVDETDGLQRSFWQQVSACQMESQGGVGCRVQWGVPDGTRDVSTREQIHDDLLLSAALCALLDKERWGIGTLAGGFVQARDPLEEMGF